MRALTLLRRFWRYEPEFKLIGLETEDLMPMMPIEIWCSVLCPSRGEPLPHIPHTEGTWRWTRVWSVSGHGNHRFPFTVRGIS